MDNIVEYASAGYTLPGQEESGDRHIIMPISNGVLIAIVDGLGHGHEAAVAAKLAITNIKHHAHQYNLIGLAEYCHATLSNTRGVVMNLAKLDSLQGTMTWLGIGNVEGRLMLKTRNADFAQQTLLLRSGVVGQNLPKLLTSTTRISRGDVLIFATDGIQTDFSDNLKVDGSVEDIAQYISSHYYKKTDDALVTVIRYMG
ncbi:MAG: SpoIIE family protein phosphatase [Gammaproteobacteria bacterium]